MASRLFTKDRRRALFITLAVVVVVLLLSARFLASFYVDYLWHDSLGRSDVFWGVLGAKLTMFALFGGVFVVTAVINLVVADRLAPLEFSANTHPLVERFHEVFGRRMRTVRIAAATVFGLVFAVPATTQWQHWMMFRHSQSFGRADAQFGNDIGFYLFRLPFITFAVDWLFAALVIILLMVVGTHLLNGGIVVQPPRPKVRRATKAHLAVLLAVLAVVKAADYWLQRYELTTADRGFVRGALYSVVNAQLPATVLLALIAVLAAGVFLSTLKTNSWRWPAVVCSLWVVIAVIGGAIYPAVVQRLVVAPNQRDKEAEFIQRNIDATRQAFGLENIEIQPVQFGSLSTDEVADDIEPLREARLLDPEKMTDRFRVDVVERAGLAINDLDVDRFEIDGRVQQVMVGAIELDLDRVRNKSWQGLHLISTHGCGLAYAPAGQVEGNGLPVYSRTDIDKPQLYFSDSIRGYSIVGTSVVETACPGQEGATEYSGTGGVQLNSPLRRAAFALDFLDYNLIASSAVDSDSRIMWVRRVQDRVRTLAPFLHFDGDPYPVTHDGRVVWIVDGYTTSDRYPYSQSADRGQLESTSGLGDPFNYIRNSVKAVVDGYDGSVRFFVMDDSDPVLRVWRSAFPDLFEPLDNMPQPLRERLRYPEELFRVQTALFSKYRLDGGQFFDGDLAWSVAQNPPEQPRGVTISDTDGQSTPTTAQSGQPADFTADVSGGRFVPYYTMFRPPGGTPADRGFVLLRPFVPFSDDDSKRELQAFMTASSDPATYGQLTAFVLPGQEEAGPLMVAASMDNDSNISKEVGLLNTPGSVVELGTMQMIPVGDGVVWLRPLYLSSETSRQPTFRYVLASYKERSAFGDSVGEALARLFSGLDIDIGDRLGSVEPGTPVEPTEPTTPPDESVQQLLADADALFAEADKALEDGDLGTYQSKVEAARELVQRAVELLAEES